MARRGEFYEDDEPIEKLEAAFERGTKAVSVPSADQARGWNTYIMVTGVKTTPPAGLGKTRAAVVR